jgi:hypothetical protein
MNAIGLSSGVLGIIGFMQDNIPEEVPQGAMVRIKVANPGVKNPGTVCQAAKNP